VAANLQFSPTPLLFSSLMYRSPPKLP